jgi:hypothetical protein
MRFCLIPLFFLVTLSFVGCSSKKVTLKKVQLDAKVESIGDGILVSRIIIEPSGGDPLAILSEYSSVLGSQNNIEELKTEGIEVCRVKSSDVPSIVSSMGRVASQQNVWHGQILQWRDVQQNQIPYQGMVIAKSGIMHFIDSGFLSLLARSWLLQREDGFFVYLQLLPTWHVPSGRSVVVTRRESPSQSKLFSDLGLEFLLLDGEAIILAVDLKRVEQFDGPLDEGPPPVRLGEALFGISVDEDMVVMLVLESSILARE